MKNLDPEYIGKAYGGRLLTIEMLLHELHANGFTTFNKKTLQRYCRNGMPGAFRAPGGRIWMIDWEEFKSQGNRTSQKQIPGIVDVPSPSQLDRSITKLKKKRAKKPRDIGDGLDNFDSTLPTWSR